MPHIDPKLVLAWQSAHCVARGAPAPVHDRGGFRVDTHSEKEVKRWVFPHLCEGLRVIAHDVAAPRHFLKLCGSDEELRSCLPARWEMQAANHFMLADVVAAKARPLPDGYRIEVHQEGPIARACVLSPDATWPQADARRKRRTSSSTIGSKRHRTTGGKAWVPQ